MVREVVCAQSNKSSRTFCKRPNEARWSGRSSVLSQTNRHVLPVNGRTRPDGQGGRLRSVNKSSRTNCKRPNEGGRLCSVNKSSRTACKRPNEARWLRRSSVLSQQIVTYFL